ncbi:MAG: hypothetical protein ACI9YL_000038, partial [Luteibaculaceae bacterium]
MAKVGCIASLIGVFLLQAFTMEGQIDFSIESPITYHGNQITPLGFSESASGDIDGDGDIDLIVTGGDVNGPISTTVYINDGNANFTVKPSNLLAVNSGTVELLDIDLDGDLDLFILGQIYSGESASRYYLNDGSGNFPIPQVVLDFNGYEYLIGGMADFTGDGFPDIFYCGLESFGGEEFSAAYVNDQVGGFTFAPGFSNVWFSEGRLLLEDLTGNGKADLIISGYNAGSYKTIFYETDSNSFNPVKTFDGYTDYVHISAGDIEKNGNKEVVITGDNNGTKATHIFRTTAQNINNYNQEESFITGVSNGVSRIVPFTGWEDTYQLFIMGYTGDSSVAEFYDFEGEFFSEISALNGLLDGVSAGDAEFADFDGNGELDMFITGYNSVNDSIADFYFNYKTGLDPVVYKNQKP